MPDKATYLTLDGEPFEAPNIQCARCHGPLADHVSRDAYYLAYPPLDCVLTIDDLREQLYAWADYALGHDDRARDRNYSIRVGCRRVEPQPDVWRCPKCNADPSDPKVPDYCLTLGGEIAFHRDGMFEHAEQHGLIRHKGSGMTFPATFVGNANDPRGDEVPRCKGCADPYCRDCEPEFGDA